MIRIWYLTDASLTKVWDIPARLTKTYNQDYKVISSYKDYPHILRRGSTRVVRGITLRFPFGLLAQENADTVPVMLKSYLAGRASAVGSTLIFDDYDDHYYQATLLDPDEEILSNEAIYDSKSMVQLGFTVTADGTFSDWDVATSLTPIART